MKKRFFTSWIAVLLLAAMLLPLGAAAQSPASMAETDEPTLRIAYQNLSFRDNVVIKYAVALDGVSSAQLLVWTSPESEYVYGTQDDALETVGTQEIEGSEYYVYDYTKLSAKQMTDEIYVRAYARVGEKDIYSDIKKYSIVEYAMTVKAGAASDEELARMVPVLNEMLEYGAASQLYFNYKTDRLATADFYRTTVVGGTLSDGTTSGIYPAGTTVALVAPAVNADGEAFRHWEDENGNPVSSPITTGSADATYTAVYGSDTAQSFTPVLRFVVASDMHLANDASAQDDRLAKLFTTAYAYSDGHETYNGLDGVFVIGDAVDKGTQEAMSRYFSIVEENLRDGTFSFTPLGNHEFYTTKNDSSLTTNEAIYAETVEWFKTASGYEDVDLHTTIGGYHFIFLSPDAGKGWNFSDAKKTWLAEQLALAAADDATGRKPIFVFQHEPPEDTVLGSEDNGVELSAIFNQYPQVVDFSGHSHYPINDPRSIYQGLYTALNTGSMKYLSYDLAGVELEDVANATDYEGGWAFLTDATVIPDGGAYYIVEVSADNAILVKGYDVDGETFCMEPILIPSVGDTEEFPYGTDRADKNDLPAFDETETVTAITDTSSLTVTFPQAASGAYVNHYRVELLRDGSTVSTEYLLSGMAQSPVPESRTVTLSGLRPDTAYTVRVTPVSSFAVDGEALSVTLSTKALDYTPTELPTPDVFELTLYGGAKDGVSGDALTASTNGTPTVRYDADFGTLAAQFNDAACYKYAGIADEYAKVSNSITMELFARIDKVTGEYDYPFSNFDKGGFGFIAYADGTFKFGVHVDGEYQYAAGKYTIGELLYAVGTYDGETVKLYINGILVDSLAVSGSIKAPQNANHKYLGIGADSGMGEAGDAPITGAIAVANVYQSALTHDQICSLYMEYMNMDVTPEADVFELELHENGTATNQTDGAALVSAPYVKNGSVTTDATAPTVSYDEDFNALAVQLDGSSAFLYSGMSEKYDMVRNTMTMEMVLRIDEVTATQNYAFSNQQSGGLGFNISNTNTVSISVNLGGTYYTASGSFTLGEVFHAVGTYDGETLRLYINGELAGETAVANGTLKDPAVTFLAIGADSKTTTNAVEYPMKGAIAVANVYSYALDADTVSYLYQSYSL